MGADFLYAAVELPPSSIDIETLCEKAEQTIRGPQSQWTRDCISDTLVGDLNLPVDDMVTAVTDTIRSVMDGDYDRCFGEIATYDKDGNPIVLTISGCMSWGDVDDATQALWLIDCLPHHWWE